MSNIELCEHLTGLACYQVINSSTDSSVNAVISVDRLSSVTLIVAQYDMDFSTLSKNDLLLIVKYDEVVSGWKTSVR